MHYHRTALSITATLCIVSAEISAQDSHNRGVLTCDWFDLSGSVGTGVDNTVRAIANFDDGTGEAIYAGGAFIDAGGVLANRIARWNGQEWTPLQEAGEFGVSSSVLSMVVFQGALRDSSSLYVGGAFETAGGKVVKNIARWDGSSWSPLSGPSGTGVEGGSVNAMAAYDDGHGEALYVAGNFTIAGGIPCNRIAKWDGQFWSVLPGMSDDGVDHFAHALAVFDDGTGPALYVGGRFLNAGGVAVNHIARWNGSTWSALAGPNGTGVNGWVWSLATFDDGNSNALYAGGFLNQAGGIAAPGLARWSGSAWSALTDTSWGVVRSMTTHDDGTGYALYAGGDIGGSGNLLKWDGVSRTPLTSTNGTGTTGTVWAVLGIDNDSEVPPGLFAGGTFITAGGAKVNRIARWACAAPPDPCMADVDDNGTIDTDDISFVILRLGMTGVPGDVDGDADGNGIVNLDDVTFVVLRLGEGCL